MTIFIHSRKYRLHFIISYQFYACNVTDEIYFLMEVKVLSRKWLLKKEEA